MYMSHSVLGGQWTVEVDLALHRPPTVQRTSRVTLNGCCAHHAELTAISMATQIHKAEMPVGSRIIDWPEDH
jgi:hypothetical protein